jgi:uncharacterized damage-inducible protein DinB
MSDEGIAPFYEGWRKANARLVGALRPLSAEQLAIRASPAHLPIWGIAAHTAGGRVYWLCGVFKEQGAETTPFIDPASGVGWEDDETKPRGADELVFALESSWKIVEATMKRWSPGMLGDTFTREINGKTQVHTRQSVIMRLITHDAYHCGEISQLLGAHGLPEIDLWRPDPS